MDEQSNLGQRKRLNLHSSRGLPEVSSLSSLGAAWVGVGNILEPEDEMDLAKTE